jgi:hypothetical protein
MRIKRFCYLLKAGLNQRYQCNPRWKKRPLMNPKNQCIFICVNLCVSVAFLKLFGINLAKKTNFHGVVVQSTQRKEVKVHSAAKLQSKFSDHLRTTWKILHHRGTEAQRKIQNMNKINLSLCLCASVVQSFCSII